MLKAYNLLRDLISPYTTLLLSCLQGHAALQEQKEQIAAALQSAFLVQLGGAEGANTKWGKCLGVRADGNLSQIRSSVGNALAEASAEQHLRAIAVVAYVEVPTAGSAVLSMSPWVALS